MTAAPNASGLLQDAELRAAYFDLVEQRFGLRLPRGRVAELETALADAAGLANAAEARDLYAPLASGQRPDVLEALAASLTVGETHFFRVPPQIAALRQVVLPALRTLRAAERRWQFWSAGCSTGEEAYTLAILAREHLAKEPGWQLRILGTDVSRAALARAEDATYGEWSFRDTPEHVRQRYFQPDGKRWRLDPAIRRLARFSYLNLASEREHWAEVVGTDLDLILCRNVTIYFSPEATRVLYERLAGLLAPGGWLILGPSDPVPMRLTLLEPVYLRDAVLWRRVGASGRPVAGRAAGSGECTEPPRPRVVAAPRRVVAPPTSRRTIEAAPLAARATARSASPGPSDAALTTAEQRVQAEPLNSSAHLGVGLLLLDRDQPERALDSLRRATFLDPNSALAQFSLGRAIQHMGDTGRAQAAFAHARRLLAGLRDDALVGEGPLLVGELREALQAQAGALRGEAPPAKR